MLKHHISCQPAFQHIVCHQSKTNTYQRPPPVLDWSYLVHLPLTGKCSKKSQFVAQIFHFSIEDKTYKSKHICLCGVVCLCRRVGVPPGSPLGSLAAVSHARPRHCAASGRISGQENATVFPASTLPSTRATLFAEGEKKPKQNKTEQNTRTENDSAAVPRQ